jgi:predicted amino acid racemase
VHGVVLLVESGDLAQGVSADRIVDLAGHVINQEGLELLGVTADFTRIGGIIPDRYNLTALANLARSIEKRYRINLPLINGGGSSALDMVTGGNIPARINCLTIGEALWFGRETSHGHRISDLYLDVFTLVAQVIECQIKDSLPTGERQTYRVDAFPEWENEGKIRRAILALGELDTDCRHLEPKLRGMGFIGSSDGLLVYNVSYLNADLNVGDDVLFSLDRVSLGRCFASSHVSRVMVR